MSSAEIILHFALRHQIAVTFAFCWLLSCASESLPKPSPSSSPFYLFIFAFSHAIAGAIPRLVALMFPAKLAAMFNTTLQPPVNADPKSPEPPNGQSA